MKATHYEPRKNNFKVHNMIANNKKTFNIIFLPKTNLGAHTVHNLSLRLRTLVQCQPKGILKIQIT